MLIDQSRRRENFAHGVRRRLAQRPRAEAASFGVPDPIYGEEIQAAVVPRADATEAELQAYCRSRLADFKVPKVIHFVMELPKDPTGKVEHLRLTDLFSK
jgi:acyl-CoA synthetase (AMP-forming)/AMP-acid ligase II